MILDALHGALELDLAAAVEERCDQVSHEILLRIDRVNLAPTEAVVVEVELDPVAAERARGVTVRASAQTIREPVLLQHSHAVGCEEARARAAFDVRAALALEDRAVDLGALQQAAEDKACRARAGDKNGGVHWRRC